MLPRQGAESALCSVWTSTQPKETAQTRDFCKAFGGNSGSRHETDPRCSRDRNPDLALSRSLDQGSTMVSGGHSTGHGVSTAPPAPINMVSAQATGIQITNTGHRDQHSRAMDPHIALGSSSDMGIAMASGGCRGSSFLLFLTTCTSALPPPLSAVHNPLGFTVSLISPLPTPVFPTSPHTHSPKQKHNKTWEKGWGGAKSKQEIYINNNRITWSSFLLDNTL